MVVDQNVADEWGALYLDHDPVEWKKTQGRQHMQTIDTPSPLYSYYSDFGGRPPVASFSAEERKSSRKLSPTGRQFGCGCVNKRGVHEIDGRHALVDKLEVGDRAHGTFGKENDCRNGSWGKG